MKAFLLLLLKEFFFKISPEMVEIQMNVVKFRFWYLFKSDMNVQTSKHLIVLSVIWMVNNLALVMKFQPSYQHAQQPVHVMGKYF